MTPAEVDHGTQVAGRYLAAVLGRDRDGILQALGEIHSGPELWDTLDALAALMRDVVAEIDGTDPALAAVRRRLVVAAIEEAQR